MRKVLLAVLTLMISVLFAGISLAQDTTLTMWTTETQPERLATTQAVIDAFTAKTNIQVKLVPVDEDGLPSLVAANLAASTLPDVMFVPVDYAATWASQGILNTKAATQVVNDLGKDTFSSLPLVTSPSGEYYAVPSDGWGQLLIYRKDLFDKAGLAAPTDFAKIEAAAKALNNPDQNFYGIVMATDPSDVFTQQSFEAFALANGVQLTDAQGKVTLNTPALVHALQTYTDLAKNYGPAGVVNVDNSRSTYFAGQAAMLVWSPFILDEMAGLRDDALPNCPECANDSAYLAKNSGLVPSFVGPDGTTPAQYGQVSLVGITTHAPEAEAVQLAEYLLSDGYSQLLSFAPEGKFPMRTGTKDKPNSFIDTWRTLKIGVDRKAPISDFYSQATVDALVNGATNFARWGLAQGQGELVGGVYSQLVFPVIIGNIMNGSMTAEEGAAEAQTQVEQIQADQMSAATPAATASS